MGNVPYQEEVVGQVTGFVAEVKEIIESKLLALDYFIARLEENMRYEVPFSTHEFVVPSLDISPYTGQPPTAPTLLDNVPEFPGDFVPRDVALTVSPFPSMDLTAPTLPVRTPPVLEDLPFTAVEPTLRPDIPLPTFPAYTLPAEYQIQPVSLRTFDGFQMPQFEGEFPVDDIGELGSAYAFAEPGFTSPITSALQTWIIDGLANGGTGLAADIEAALFAQYRSRLDEEFEPQFRKEMTFFASRGFSRPPGALRGAIQEITNQYNRRMADASRDIMIKQAELAQSNTQFILKLSGDYEKSLQDFYQASTNRMLEAAKTAVMMASEQLNARINKYNAVLKAYEVKASVFESQIKAMMLLVEEYKAEAEAAKLSLEVQSMYSQLYKDQLAGIGLLLDGYEKQMRGAVAFIEVETNKIRLFQSQVEAFAARVGVDDRRLKLFTSQLESDKSIVNVWAEKVRGFGLHVDAAKSQNDGSIAVANLQNEIWNRTGIESYKLQLARAESIIKNIETINQSRTQIYESDVRAYSANIQAYAANAEAVTKAFSAQADYAAKQIELIIKEADINQDALNAEHAVKTESLKAMVNVLAQLIASALSAIHTSMTMGYSGGYNASLSYQPDRHVSEVHEYKDYCDATCTGA